MRISNKHFLRNLKSGLVVYLICQTVAAMQDNSQQNIRKEDTVISIQLNITDVANSLGDRFNSSTGELNLSNIPVTDAGLKVLFQSITKFVDKFKVKRLVLENMELTQIPYYVIGFALKNNTLCYVSLNKNKFAITTSNNSTLRLHMPYQDDDDIDDADIEAAINQHPVSRGFAARPDTKSALVSLVSVLWSSVSPAIEQTIKDQNESMGNSELIQKTILIDESMPPLVVVDKKKLPKTNCQKFKLVTYKLLYIVAGAAITLLPTMMMKYNGQDTVTCDQDQLSQMMAACNVTTY